MWTVARVELTLGAFAFIVGLALLFSNNPLWVLAFFFTGICIVAAVGEEV